LSDARVHYPLTKHPPHQPPYTDQPPAQEKGGHEEPHPRDTFLPGAMAPDSSGPNSVPTPTPPKTGPRFHTSHAGSTKRPPRTGRRFVDDSTSEHHQVPTTRFATQERVRWSCGVRAP
jgi:hypothetical protein